MITAFLYLHCEPLGLDQARRFYSHVLGLAETFFSADDGTVGYRVGDLQITIEAHPEATTSSGWAKQLGWRGGVTATPSWGIEFSSAAFAPAVEAARASDVECWQAAPEWVGYWSFPIKDPMGNTVELSAPERSAWTSSEP